jgi:dihydroflavonol-4-reductase
MTPPRRKAAARPFAVGAGDRVVVTGGAGFIGSAVVRALLGRGAAVTATVEPGGGTENLDGLDVDTTTVDIRDRDAVFGAVAGARFVFHVAALYGFWPRDPTLFYDVNVAGSRNVIDAAVAAGCERIAYTSSVATIGLGGTAEGTPATESSYADVAHLFGSYKQSKYVAEHEVLRGAAEGAPVVLVQPTFPLGPRDRRPTPTGKLVLDFLNGRMPGYVDTTMNVVHVDDLADGHLRALEDGAQGRSYIIGGENLSMSKLLEMLSGATALPAHDRKFPSSLAVGAAFASDLIQGRILGREPSVPLEAARMSRTHMLYDDSRARDELGYSSRPAIEAVEGSARWFVANGYVSPARRDRIAWAAPETTP